MSSYNMGPSDAKPFTPTVGSVNAAPAAIPAILAGLPSMLLPGLAVVLIIGLLRLFKDPILRMLGVQPIANDAMYRSPYNAPYGAPYGSPYGQQGSPYGQPGMYGAPPTPADAEASLQQLLSQATPEEAEQLQQLMDRMKSRNAQAPAMPQGSAARPSAWVTPEPVVANAEALSPEERRERARQKAREQAQAQMQDNVRSSTETWANRQAQAERQAAQQVPPPSFSQLEEDQKFVAVASVVLTSFVVAEADARGFKTR